MKVELQGGPILTQFDSEVGSQGVSFPALGYSQGFLHICRMQSYARSLSMQ